MGHSSEIIAFICPVYRRGAWGPANNEIVCVMFLEADQESATPLIKNCSISVLWCCLGVCGSCSECSELPAEECVHYCPLYAFSSTYRTRVTRIRAFYKSCEALSSCTRFPFEWTLFSLLAQTVNTINGSSSVYWPTFWPWISLSPPYARLKYERTLQHWGEHGTSPKEPFHTRVRPPYV